MGYRYDDLAPGEVYHVFSRGVEKRKIFLDYNDRQRFLSLLIHCLHRGPSRCFSLSKKMKEENNLVLGGEGLVDLLCYCLMDNHVHLLIRENIEGGTSLYMRRLLTSYSRYFNIRCDRSGSLFIHPFKAILIEQDEQLLHVSRYIHLNPYVARITGEMSGYEWSSLDNYTSGGLKRNIMCHRTLIHSMMSANKYRSFVEDEADYARSIADVGHLLIDLED
ncbi:MAG: transposase [bacterium]